MVPAIAGCAPKLSVIAVELCVCVCVCVCCSVVSNSGTPWTVTHQAPLSVGISPGKNTGVGSHSLLQGKLPTQGSNPGLSLCRQILYHLSHQGSWSSGIVYILTIVYNTYLNYLWTSGVMDYALLSTGWIQEVISDGGILCLLVEPDPREGPSVLVCQSHWCWALPTPLPTVLNFSHSEARASQPQHCWHFGLDDSLLVVRGAQVRILCVRGSSAAYLLFIHWMPPASIPLVVIIQVSLVIASCPLGGWITPGGESLL